MSERAGGSFFLGGGGERVMRWVALVDDDEEGI